MDIIMWVTVGMVFGCIIGSMCTAIGLGNAEFWTDQIRRRQASREPEPPMIRARIMSTSRDLEPVNRQMEVR